MFNLPNRVLVMAVVSAFLAGAVVNLIASWLIEFLMISPEGLPSPLSEMVSILRMNYSSQLASSTLAGSVAVFSCLVMSGVVAMMLRRVVKIVGV